jgi:hypothetical protein
MWAEIVAFDLPDPDVTSITESVNERYRDVTTVEKTRAEPEDRNCARRLEILPSGSYRRVVADRSMLAAA